MWQRIKRLFKRNNEVEELMGALVASQQISNTHIIALARLMFIKPESLLREANNVRANADYLLELVKLQEELKKNVKA